MPKILSSTALRNGYNDVSQWCHETQQPVFITKNGNGDLALMSIDAYERLVSNSEVEYKLAVGRQAAKEGRTLEADEAIAALRNKHEQQ